MDNFYASIAIIGRQNAGKSSLFNRFCKERIAITSEVAGTTRDVKKALITWEDKPFLLMDTGGLDENSELFKTITRYSFQTGENANLILYLVDGKTPVNPQDKKLFYALQKKNPLCFLVVNKIDNEKEEQRALDFMEFGAKNMFFISVSHNRGIQTLQAAIIKALLNPNLERLFTQNTEESLEDWLETHDSFRQDYSVQKDSLILSKQNSTTHDFPQDSCLKSPQNSPNSSKQSLVQSQNSPQKPHDFIPKMQSAYNSTNFAQSSHDSTQSTHNLDDFTHDSIEFDCDLAQSPQNPLIHIGIIGRVNVGKSSLLNALLGQERSVVSPQAGTTLDPVDELGFIKNQKVCFIDTAGIRRSGKIEGLEKFALQRTRAVLEKTDIAILVLDASTSFVELDEKIAGLIEEYKLGVVVVLNKWDIACKDFKSLIADYKLRFKFLEYAPLITLSAKTKRHLNKLQEAILKVYQNFTFRIPTAQLNAVIKEATIRHPLPSDKGKIVKIYYATQFESNPPQIALIMNRPKSLHFSYKRYLVNVLRESFDFSGVRPILLAKDKKSQTL